MFAIAFNDVDFCLKLAALGRRNIYCADVELYHHESVSRGYDRQGAARKRLKSESQSFIQKWPLMAGSDPMFNPFLSRKTEACKYALPAEVDALDFSKLKVR